jgi:hypothetical protein
MRLPALVVIATVGVSAGQAPIIQTQPANQPPRDVVKPAEPTGTARIKGRVVAADRGTPIRRATVSLIVFAPPTATRGQPPDLTGGRGSQPPAPMAPRRAVTDGDGQFEFAGLPAGTYRVSASPPQYASQYVTMSYGATRPAGPFWPEPGHSIELKEGQSLDKINIALPRGAIITGRVLDENGEPLARVQVYTLGFPPGVARGQRFGGGMTTDDLGQYRLWGLVPGEYVVVADARMNSFIAPNAPPETEEERVGYLTTYYPGAVDETSAQRLRVKAGEETQGIDIRVGQARLYHVSGVAIDSKGRPVAGGNGQLMRRGAAAGSSGFFAMTDPKGQFQIRNVPPGEYRFMLRLPQNVQPFSTDTQREPVETASVPVSVGNADVDNLTVVTSLGVTVTGQVVFEQGPPTPPASGANTMRVFAVAMNPEDSAGVPSPEPAIIGADGSFTLKGLMGEYGIRTGMTNQYIKSVTVNGQDMTDVAHEFKSSDRVTITVTSRVSTVEGTVTDLRDAQVADVGIILFSEDRAAWRFNSFWTRRTGLEPNGHFRVTGLMPGRYYIAAVSRQRLALPGGSDATAFFEQLAKEATSVLVGVDDQRTVDLRLTDSPQ